MIQGIPQRPTRHLCTEVSNKQFTPKQDYFLDTSSHGQFRDYGLTAVNIPTFPGIPDNWSSSSNADSVMEDKCK